MALLPGVPLTETVLGPSLLCLGDFVTPRTPHGRKVKDRGGLMHRFGMDDESTAAMLSQLAGEGSLPAFTLAYFADNDYRSHEVGPQAALPVIDRVDGALGEMFDAAGGFERFIEDTCIVVTSDHGHCEVLDDSEQALILLDQVLGDFRQAELGRAWRARDEIMICPNMRAAQIHLREPAPVLLDRVTRAALSDPRIDLILRRQKLTATGTDVYVVHSQRGRLEFWRGAGGHSHARDAFGTSWSWNGDAAALQLHVDEGVVDSTEYPNAFERIAGALDAANGGDVWLSARPGCEFEVPGGKGHVGGASHGALHSLDSLSLAVVGGANAPTLPRVLRSVDIAPLCMTLLGLPMRYRVGEPRTVVHRPVPARPL
jgi:hypothetical protein